LPAKRIGGLTDSFPRLIEPLGPFEHDPDMAVAVSGGPDSLALTLLLADWLSTRGGRLFAITVDHGLRPESAAEAQQVSAWLAGRPGVSHHILEWLGPKPKSGVQAAARMARYGLMTDFCRAHGILHLCLGHHLGDQWETYSMRAERGGTEHGLSGMSGIRPWRGVRLLRPLLPVSKGDLTTYLGGRGQPWIEDPSNSNADFERVRARAEPAPSGPAAIITMSQTGNIRRRWETAAAALLAQSLTIHAEGYALLHTEAFHKVTPDSMLAFGWVLQSIGGTDYMAPATRRNTALAVIRVPEWPGFTLGGCEVLAAPGEKGERFLVCRDWGAIRERRSAAPGDRFSWDHRFDIRIDPDLPSQPAHTVAKLGERGVQWLGRHWQSLAGHPIPEPARKALPALWVGNEPVAAPYLGFGSGMKARFRPQQAVTSCGFTVAY
jgi:tRNA(Ile)-lysidine synthase